MKDFDLALQHHRAGRLAEAEQLYRHVLAEEPQHADAIQNLGILAGQLGRKEEALKLNQRVVALRPDSADAHVNLGNALRDNGQLEDAIAAFGRAIALRPDFAQAHSNLGNALRAGGQLDEAIAAHRQAIALNPSLFQVHSNLGDALTDKGLAEEAIAAYREALILNPNLPEEHFKIGDILRKQWRLDEAVIEYRHALRLSPSFREAYPNLFFALHYQVPYDRLAIYREHISWAQGNVDGLASQARPHLNTPDPERRLRIGYVSSDFREHAVAFFIESLLASHDPREVDVFCYIDMAKSDATTQRLRKMVPNWRETTGRDDSAVGQMIRDDRIDILVDLSGHSAGNRLLVFAVRPAPVQVAYLGYFDTTGMKAMDYRFTDDFADPPGMTEQFHTEQLMRLPRTFACYCPPAAAPDVGPLPAISNGYVTFANFGILQKINLPLLECWSEILGRVPRSRLMLMAKGLQHASVQQRILAIFRDRGIDPERLTLLKARSLEEYLAMHQRVDVILDSFPVNGHTVTCHGLWMGVPVVSLAGNAYCQRLGFSVMSNLGLSDLVAQTPREYAEIAVRLANDLPRLMELRATMRARMLQSPLMDGPGFARNIEAAYRQIWRTWCATRPMPV